MFTGIIEEIGEVVNISKARGSAILEISTEKLVDKVDIGDSVAVNGVCLTVTQLKNITICFEVISETIENTNIGNLNKGDLVNLEQSLKMNDNLSGHLVTGHIDGTGKIINISKISVSQVKMEIKTLSTLMKFIVSKGSICVDGISLTITAVKENVFEISLTPFTLNNTTLGEKGKGEEVNIEIDLIARYIHRIIWDKEKSSIDKNFLEKYGFLK